MGQKTFSGEGLDVMVPMLEEMLDMLADDGIANAVLGMAHRGRLNVIAHVVEHAVRRTAWPSSKPRSIAANSATTT